MDRNTIAELKAVLRQAIAEDREMCEEVWLTEKQLIAQFGMFTHDWLKKYGHCLHPARAIVVDENGVEHPTQGWAYPKYRIQRMIATGEITKLKCRIVRLDRMNTARVAMV